MNTFPYLQLATSSERDGKRVIALFEYLLAEPAARVRLAQQWLFGEYFADEQRYRLMLEQFIEAYSRPGLSRVLVSFLGQLPLFDSSVLNQLTSLVLRDPSSYVAFSTRILRCHDLTWW